MSIFTLFKEEPMEPQFPRAKAFLNLLTKEMILSWLFESTIGKNALGKLERKLSKKI